MNTKIIAGLVSIAAVAAVAGGATIAYFSDVETSTANTFAAGTLALDFDGTTPATFAVSNIAPGSFATKYWKLENNGSLDGNIDIANVAKAGTEDGCKGGELTDDSDCATDTIGELPASMDVKLFVDVDGDGLDSDDIVIYDGKLGSINAEFDTDLLIGDGEEKTIGLYWIVPTSVDNKIQGDGATLSLNFVLDQVAD
jgi:predicted ribosomally synthesized peptide with SipW-like signal peptide